MNKKLMILIAMLVLVAFNVYAQTEEKIEITSYSGMLKQIGDSWFLNTGGDVLELSLAPAEFLIENELELTSKMDLTLNGIMLEEQLIVHSILIEDTEIKLRDEAGLPLWQNKTYFVKADECIGCRLCVKACPQGAISMVKGVAVIDADKCDGDGICVDGDGKRYKGCPVNAIKQAE